MRIPLLSYRQSNRKLILRWRQRARRIGCICARRILQAVEVEHNIAGLVEAVVGEIGVEKTCSAVGRRLAGCVAQDEEELFVSRLFNHWLKLERLAIDRELGDS